MRSALWGLVACVAVLWPSRLTGPIDGAPLDTRAEVLLVALVLPIAWLLNPRLFQPAVPRALAATLAVWKLATWLLLTQQGLCATFAVGSGTPDHFVLRRSWDFRTPTVDGLPQCSAVLTRSLDARNEFPAWFLNLPVGTNRSLDAALDRSLELPQVPPVRMHVSGVVAGRGELRPVDQELLLDGESWRFAMPLARAALGGETVTIADPTALDRAMRHLGLVSPLLTVLLVASVAWRTFARLRVPMPVAASVALLTAVSVVLGLIGDPFTRATALLLPAAALFRLPRRLQGLRGVVLSLGIPLLAMLAAANVSQVGRFTIYSAGDDWQTFQRFAARIYFDGYWLEGGEPTFWQQPFYRWIAGALHVVFGDSSVGETVWDGFGLIAGAALAYGLVRSYAGHRWAMAAAAGTLATTLLGPTWYFIGRGLSEITATMWLALAACALLRARHGSGRAAIVGGVFATLAIYTRLNHLILAIALVLLLLPAARVGAWVRPAQLIRGLRPGIAGAYIAVIAIGLALFAARTWYYTGHFSLLHGTTRNFNSTGLSFDTIGEPAVWARVLDSVLMVITISDPPRFDPRSVLVLVGVVVALLGMLRLPVVSDVPLAPAVLCLMALSSAFIARGLAYPGRFSVHLIPLAVSVSVLMAARLAGRVRA